VQTLVYHGPGATAWEEVADPKLAADTDAIIRVDASTTLGAYRTIDQRWLSRVGRGVQR